MPVGRRVGQRFRALAMPQWGRIAAHRRFECEGVLFVDLEKGQQISALAEIRGSSRGGNNQTAKLNGLALRDTERPRGASGPRAASPGSPTLPRLSQPSR